MEGIISVLPQKHDSSWHQSILMTAPQDDTHSINTVQRFGTGLALF